ncbi:MGMT family protein [Alteromonas sp. SM 2104]|nr:MGMT family protein [Alteromonas oceanisediminis]
MGNFEKIWRVVTLVPSGCVASYGQIADLAGLPGRARLTSKALGKAPESLGLPWYRIVRSTGQIAFPAGSELAQTQRVRLIAEGVHVNGRQICMQRFGWKPEISTLLYELEF